MTSQREKCGVRLANERTDLTRGFSAQYRARERRPHPAGRREAGLVAPAAEDADRGVRRLIAPVSAR